MVTKQYSFRLDDESIKQLDYLCDMYNKNRTQVIESLVQVEYYKSSKIGKKKIEELQNGLNVLSAQLESIMKNNAEK